MTQFWFVQIFIEKQQLDELKKISSAIEVIILTGLPHH